jgi:hypothetical protein
MATTIKLKNGSGAPLAGDLVAGEPALDLTNKRLYTEDSGGTVIEVGTNPGTDVTFADNRKAIFGAGSDLQIYHDGSHSRIDEQGTGVLFLQTNGTNIQLNKGTSENMLVANVDGSVDLYYDNSKKLATTSTGIDVTGNVGITGSGNTDIYLNTGNNSGDNNRLFFGDTADIDVGYLSYDHGTNTMSFGVNAAERMRIDASGNVGIGTSSPIRNLQIGDHSGAQQALSIQASTTGKSDIFLGDGTGSGEYAGLVRYDHASDFMAFWTASTERMRIDSSGNLLVNSTSAGALASSGRGLIDVDGTSDSAIELKAGGSTYGYLYTSSSQFRVANLTANPVTFFTNNTERMRIDGSGNLLVGTTDGAFINGGGVKIANATAARLKLCDSNSAGTGSADGFELTQSGTAAYIYQNENDFMAFGTNATERMRIDSSGKVGIGTSSPARILHVENDGLADLLLRDTSSYSVGTGPAVIFQGKESGGTNTQFGAIYGVSNGSNSGELTFETRNSGSSAERMRIDTSGNLLVGTTSSVGNSGKFQAVRSNTGAIGYFEVDNGGGAQNAVDITNAANAAFVPLRFWVNGYGGSLVGSISCTTSATTYNTSSDQRLKENIVDAPAGNIDDIRVRSFDWKVDGSHQTYGMVAQELVDVAPEAVSQGATEDDMWQVDYSKLVPMMIKEIQDLKAEVAALKGE